MSLFHHKEDHEKEPTPEELDNNQTAEELEAASDDSAETTDYELLNNLADNEEDAPVAAETEPAEPSDELAQKTGSKIVEAASSDIFTLPNSADEESKIFDLDTDYENKGRAEDDSAIAQEIKNEYAEEQAENEPETLTETETETEAEKAETAEAMPDPIDFQAETEKPKHHFHLFGKHEKAPETEKATEVETPAPETEEPTEVIDAEIEDEAEAPTEEITETEPEAEPEAEAEEPIPEPATEKSAPTAELWDAPEPETAPEAPSVAEPEAPAEDLEPETEDETPAEETTELEPEPETPQPDLKLAPQPEVVMSAAEKLAQQERDDTTIEDMEFEARRLIRLINNPATPRGPLDSNIKKLKKQLDQLSTNLYSTRQKYEITYGKPAKTPAEIYNQAAEQAAA